MSEGALPGGTASGVWAAAVHSAVDDLQSYLSDQVAPLLVVDAVTLLLDQPPELGAEALRSWVAGQLRSPGQELTLGDYLFHAVKKVQLLARLKLVDEARLLSWVHEVTEILLSRVPEGDRGKLRTLLGQAVEGEASFAPTVERLHRPAAAVAPGVPTGSAMAAAHVDLAASVQQFSRLLARLAPASGNLDMAAVGEVAPHLLAAAAESAHSSAELEQRLQALSRAGLPTQARLSDLFATLSLSVPNWWIGGGDETTVSAPVQAMHRIVALAADPEQTRGHYRQLVKTIAQNFNEGSLARAAQVAELAQRLVAEGKVDKVSAELVLENAYEELDFARLLAEAKNPASFPALRQVVNTYPALTPNGLLAALDDEPDRTRRRLWLALLEAHGLAARRATLDRLERSFDRVDPGPHLAWQRRNFIYLLHHIKPAPGADPVREIRLCARCADLNNPAPLVREALTDLGQRHHPEAESALRQRVELIERMLDGAAPATHDAPELRRMLGLAIAGLARQASPSARRTVVEHGLKQKASLGDTLERLAELGTQDLADDPELVEALLAALRAQLPVRVLGMALRRQEGALPLVRALQGTSSEAVKRTLSDLAARFPGEPFGQAAAAALAAPPAAPTKPTTEPTATSQPAAPPVALAGDLEAFGLPELLQTLVGMQASGRLLLRARNGNPIGELLLREGALRAARVRDLPLADAFYQLVEAPQPGTFEFVRQAPDSLPAGPDRDVMSMVLEGMRRYDELQRARALAPDHAYLRATGNRPTPPPGDADGAFVRALWTRVKDGATPRQCEEAVASDAYRVRSLLAHWLSDGSLAIREPVEHAPP